MKRSSDKYNNLYLDLSRNIYNENKISSILSQELENHLSSLDQSDRKNVAVILTIPHGSQIPPLLENDKPRFQCHKNGKDIYLYKRTSVCPVLYEGELKSSFAVCILTDSKGEKYGMYVKDRYKNYYTLIGGTTEVGETPDEGLIRELREESYNDGKSLLEITQQDIKRENIFAVCHMKGCLFNINDIRDISTIYKFEFDYNHSICQTMFVKENLYDNVEKIYKINIKGNTEIDNIIAFPITETPVYGIQDLSLLLTHCATQDIRNRKIDERSIQNAIGIYFV